MKHTESQQKYTAMLVASYLKDSMQGFEIIKTADLAGQVEPYVKLLGPVSVQAMSHHASLYADVATITHYNMKLAEIDAKPSLAKQNLRDYDPDKDPKKLKENIAQVLASHVATERALNPTQEKLDFRQFATDIGKALTAGTSVDTFRTATLPRHNLVEIELGQAVVEALAANAGKNKLNSPLADKAETLEKIIYGAMLAPRLLASEYAAKQDQIVGLTVGMAAKLFGKSSPLSDLLDHPEKNQDTIVKLLRGCRDAAIERAEAITPTGNHELDTNIAILQGCAIAQQLREDPEVKASIKAVVKEGTLAHGDPIIKGLKTTEPTEAKLRDQNKRTGIFPAATPGTNQSPPLQR
jgi:hypothetical protein